MSQGAKVGHSVGTAELGHGGGAAFQDRLTKKSASIIKYGHFD